MADGKNRAPHATKPRCCALLLNMFDQHPIQNRMSHASSLDPVQFALLGVRNRGVTHYIDLPKSNKRKHEEVATEDEAEELDNEHDDFPGEAQEDRWQVSDDGRTWTRIHNSEPENLIIRDDWTGHDAELRESCTTDGLAPQLLWLTLGSFQATQMENFEISFEKDLMADLLAAVTQQIDFDVHLRSLRAQALQMMSMLEMEEAEPQVQWQWGQHKMNKANPANPRWQCHRTYGRTSWPTTITCPSTCCPSIQPPAQPRQPAIPVPAQPPQNQTALHQPPGPSNFEQQRRRHEQQEAMVLPRVICTSTSSTFATNDTLFPTRTAR